jgi:hypothetical protein
MQLVYVLGSGELGMAGKPWKEQPACQMIGDEDRGRTRG